jgi:hypothetical protein
MQKIFGRQLLELCTCRREVGMAGPLCIAGPLSSTGIGSVAATLRRPFGAESCA